MLSERRDFLKQMSYLSGSMLAGHRFVPSLSEGLLPADPLALPPLPYAYDALEPVLDKQTLVLHHDKHHAGYVKGFNGVLKKIQAASRDGDFSGMKHFGRDLAFHGSGHVLHTLYWHSLSPEGGGKPGGRLGKTIRKEFGSFDLFRKQLISVSRSVEGSGWGLLGYHPGLKKLLILPCEKHQNLTVWGIHPLIVIDVWEHAYYLKYQNRRLEYIEKLFEILDWKGCSERYDQLLTYPG
jgi:Fe-Mn family superoxide dismutase